VGGGEGAEDGVLQKEAQISIALCIRMNRWNMITYGVGDQVTVSPHNVVGSGHVITPV
jgi:hypothetical protein